MGIVNVDSNLLTVFPTYTLLNKVLNYSSNALRLHYVIEYANQFRHTIVVVLVEQAASNISSWRTGKMKDECLILAW